MRRLLFVLVGLVACDPVVDRHTPDATMIDGAPDAPTHGMVSVKVYDPNNTQTVVQGVPVVFVEADGTLVGRPTTGTDGVAMADVHTNATATVVITIGGSTQMETLVGLKPGDNVVLGPNYAPQVQDGTFTVSFPQFSVGYNYTVYGPCGSYNTTDLSVTMTLYSDCKQDTMDVFVVANDSQGNPAVMIDKPNVPYTAGGNTAITGNYQGLQTFTASYTNIDPAITYFYMQRSAPDTYGFNRGNSGTATSGSLSLTAPAPQVSTAQVWTYANKGSLQSQVMQKISGNGLTYGLDVGATLLPWLAQPTFDAATHKFTQPIDTTGTSTDMPDVYYTNVQYQRTVAGVTTNFAWLVLAPAPADFTLPTLPPEVGDVMPKPTDTVNYVYSQMIESDTLTGWDQVRADPFTAIIGLQNNPHSPATRLRSSSFNGD